MNEMNQTGLKKYQPLSFSKKIKWTIIYSLIINGTFQLFIIPMGIVTGSTFGTFTGIAGTIQLLNESLGWTDLNLFGIVYWLLFLIWNVIIIIWGYKKFYRRDNTREFMHLSVVYVITGLIIGFLFLFLQNHGLMIFPYLGDIAYSSSYPDHLTNKYLIMNLSYLTIIVATLIGSTIIGIFTALIYSINSNTSNLDPIALYLSETKTKDFGEFIGKYTLINGIFFISLNFYFLPLLFQFTGIRDIPYYWLYDANNVTKILGVLLDPRVIGTLIFAFSFPFWITKIFPRNKVIEIEIIDKSETKSESSKIYNSLINSNYNHQIMTYEATFDNKQVLIIKTNLNWQEKNPFLWFLNSLELNETDFIIKINDLHLIDKNYNNMIIDKYELNKK